MKKIIAVLTLGLLLLTSGIGTVYADENGWYGTNSEEHYTILEEGVILSDDSFIFLGPDNIGETDSNFYVRKDYTTTGDYTVSVKATGTEGLPVQKDVNMGIVPYYLDDENFIIVYVQWATWDRPTDIRCVQFTGILDGKPIELFDALYMEYNQSKWNDNWCDGITVPSTEGFTFEVDKVNAGDNVVFTFICSYNGTVLSSGEYTLAAKHFTEEGAVGIFANGDTVTFEDFTYTEIVSKDSTEEEDDSKFPSEDKDTEKKDDVKDDVKTDNTMETPASDQKSLLLVVAVILVVILGITGVVIVRKRRSTK